MNIVIADKVLPKRVSDTQQTTQITVAAPQPPTQRTSARQLTASPVVANAIPNNQPRRRRGVAIDQVYKDGSSNIFIAADIGGTNARFGLYNVPKQRMFKRSEYFTVTYSTADPPVPKNENGKVSLAEVMKKFAERVAIRYPALGGDKIAFASLAIAGPVQQHGDKQTATLTNADWEPLDSKEIEEVSKLKHVSLINDFEAAGRGLSVMITKDTVKQEHISKVDLAKIDDYDMLVLNKGKDPPVRDELTMVRIEIYRSYSPIVVMGPGTGLGEAILTPETNGGYRTFPTEGGHSGFAPYDDVTRALHAFYTDIVGFVEQETFLCGRGLVNLYIGLQALYWDESSQTLDYNKNLSKSDIQEAAKATKAKFDELHQEIQPYHITTAYLRSQNPTTPEDADEYTSKTDILLNNGTLKYATAVDALKLFLTCLGAEAGALGLKTLCWDGIYLAGGITKRPGVIAALKDHLEDTFLAGFYKTRRESFDKVVQDLPVYLITNEGIGLLGALQCAVESAGLLEVRDMWLGSDGKMRGKQQSTKGIPLN